MADGETLHERIPIDRLAQVCRRWGVARLWAFGSVLGDLGPTSDIDLLVEFLPGTKMGLLEGLDLRDELEALVGRPVDLVERQALDNPFRRQSILSKCVEVYAA